MIVEPAYSMQVVDRTDAVPPISQIVLMRGTTLIFGSSVDDNNLGLWFMSAVKLPKLVSILMHVDRIMLTSAEGLYQVLSIGMRVCVPALAYLSPPQRSECNRHRLGTLGPAEVGVRTHQLDPAAS